MKIIWRDGQGWPAKPYDQEYEQGTLEPNKLPVVNPDGSPAITGEGDAQRVWQHKPWDEKEWAPGRLIHIGLETREVWQLTPEKVENNISDYFLVSGLPTASAIDASVVYGPGNDNYGRDIKAIQTFENTNPLTTDQNPYDLCRENMNWVQWEKEHGRLSEWVSRDKVVELIQTEIDCFLSTSKQSSEYEFLEYQNKTLIRLIDKLNSL